jgi:uncharacterized membrane protein
VTSLLATDNLVQVSGWIAVVIVLLGLFWMGWFMLRRWFRNSIADSEAADVWTMQELRDLLAQGKITKDEFDRMRRQIVGSFQDTE